MNLGEETQQSFPSELRRHIIRASQIAGQHWSVLGVDDDLFPHAIASDSVEVTAEYVTSLLLVRLLVLASEGPEFKDYSTASVCETLLGTFYLTSAVPQSINENVVRELRTFVRAMLHGYNDVPYHNFKHAYHVLVSSSTLMDMILKNAPQASEEDSQSDSPPFEKDGLMQLALLFAALVHDTQHEGVPNAQLVIENHPLALQYNDQSVAEQRSLTVAFLELLQPAYDNLRAVMFPEPRSGDDYRRFRGAVTSLILATDIATPARGKEVRERWETIFKNCRDEQLQETGSAGTKRQTKTASGLPVLSPPREHPTPSRRRRKLAIQTPSAPKRKESKSSVGERSWIDCGPTPSKHFPKSMVGASMHDSLVFWWFSPEQLDNDDEGSLKTFEEDDTTAIGSLSMHDLTTLSDQSGNEDFDASISLFSENDITTCDQSALSDDYPHESKAFQFSCSTLNDSSHHLLSTSRVQRRNRSFTRGSSRSLSRSRRKEASSGYNDMSYSDHDSFGSKPRTIFDAFSACTPKRKAKKADMLVDYFEAERAQDSTCQPGSSSSLLTGSLTADLTCTDASNSNNTLTVTGMDSSNSLNFLEMTESQDVDDAKVEELPLKGEEPESPPAAPVVTVDHKARSLSLIEHILLVADVSHTMQCWDTMNMFSLRLSKEIRKAIKKGRSGGITVDPLSDWYTNQSAFLNGYIMPLAQRLEQTKTLPPADDDSSAGFLSSFIQRNLDRWQDQGHDVIAGWRREREQRAEKRAMKKLQKKQSKRDLSSKPKRTKSSKSSSSGGTKSSKKDRMKGPVLEVPSPVTNTQPCTMPSPDAEELAGKIHA